jgi:carboxymethylenebutenolidase
MALLKGEGTHQILYGSADIFSGVRHNRGYLARPDHAGSFPAVLLVHGRAGLTSSVKSIARRLARYGLAVVAPDLFRGGRRLRQPPPAWPEERRVVSDLEDTLTWMYSTDTPWIRRSDIGVLALDAAGAAAQAFARRGEAIDRLVLISPTTATTGGDLPVPVLGFFGKDDEIVSTAEQEGIRARLGHTEWVLYGGAGHGLLDEGAADYRWDVAEDVLDRIVAFFGREPKS